MKCFRILCLLNGLLCAAALADHGETGPARPKSEELEKQVRGIFSAKCQTCHYGDGKFTEDDLPSAEWRDKILKALNHETGVRPMPPSSKAQLTDAEKAVISQWAGKDQTSKEDACSGKGTPINPAVMKGIFADRCVTCHGKLSFNPTSVLRSSHNQFLTNDGALDFSVLGDMSEIQPYNMPKGKTSLGRILEALSNYTMPPRGNLPVINRPSDSLFPQIGTPHMTDGERQFLIGALKQIIQRENCPPKGFTVVAGAKTGTLKFADGAKACSNLGMRIPTRKQMETSEALLTASVPARGCVWSSTFDEDPAEKKAWRKMLYFDSRGNASFGSAVEKAKCQTVCVR